MYNKEFNCDKVVRFLVDYEGTRRWFMMEHVSRDNDQPAVEYADGSRCWYWMGVQHRANDLPAVERADGSKEWWVYGNWIKTVSADGKVTRHPSPDRRRSAFFAEEERRFRKILKTSAVPRTKKPKLVRAGIADLTEWFSTEAKPFKVHCFVSGNPQAAYWEDLLFNDAGINALIDWFAKNGNSQFARWESGGLFAFDHDYDEFRASARINVTTDGSTAMLWKLYPEATKGLAVIFEEFPQ